LKFISKPEPLGCHGSKADLTYLTKDGWLKMNETALSSTNKQLVCSYRCYDRVDSDDQQLQYEEWIEIKGHAKPGCEFMETRCKKASFPGSVVYSNNHNQVLRRNISSPSVAGKRSVILIVFDSVSHSNFIRSMPKSLQVSKLYKSYVFEGMSKVGDQSFPNAVAFLAGKGQFLEFGNTDGYFDDHPLIWKDFEKSGYSTYYAEDYPKFNLFFYLAKGFKRKPVHHYFRPFWLNVYGSFMHRRSKFLCYGNSAMHGLQLNYLSQFLLKYKGTPQFALNWHTELGHDYMNQINVADDDFADFLTRHFEALKDSFLFILSDHGHRFDSIRRTAVGRIEERFPFFSMHIPDDIRKRYPAVHHRIEANTKVRSSLFMSPAACSIPDRNCKEAGIPDELCMCHMENAVDVARPEIRLLAKELIGHLNNVLAPHKRCAKLELSKILHASVFDNDDRRDEIQHYRLTAEARPSLALFEAVLKYDRATNSSLVYGNVNRINPYGNQSDCVFEQELRKFCYCVAS
uniref:Sulfatase domain-containing protein n=1 Tax=Heligmosomoides polygyrus TaxID=6339 RepID=A0A8L8KD74_HELPZ